MSRDLGEYIAKEALLPELSEREARGVERLLDLLARPEDEFTDKLALMRELHSYVVETTLGLQYLQKLRKRLGDGAQVKDGALAKGERILAMFTALDPVFALMDDIAAEDSEEAPAVLNLCQECGIRSTCPKQSANVVDCDDQRQYIADKCPGCDFWDVDNCVLAQGCKGGEYHVPSTVRSAFTV